MHPIPSPTVHALHHRFLSLIPLIERGAATAFRRVRCPHDRADLVQETLRAGWELFLADDAPDASDAIAGLFAERAVALVLASRRPEAHGSPGAAASHRAPVTHRGITSPARTPERQ